MDSIQALRAIAAIAVVFCHAQKLLGAYAGRYGLGDAWLNRIDPFLTGQCGVDIFFVISGFIMALVTNGMHGRKGAIGDFAQKRLNRIFPPYWIWTSVLLFFLFFFPQFFSTQTFVLKDAILSFLLIPYAPSGLNPSPVLAVGWTLSYEMYFYALVCIGLLFSRTAFIVGLGIFFLLATAVFPQKHGPVSSLTANPLLWEFYAGVLLFEVYKAGARLPVMLSLCLGLLA
ncbi:MAG: acyltransferase, partial [Deltaproteobacteria bacterium]|nr:acyltransferase [Deltaproteobacteria bacterium]